MGILRALLGLFSPGPTLLAPPVADPIKSLAQRCLELSGSFENDCGTPECFGAMSGDFDSQGLSYGALQRCVGQGSLQPLLKQACADHPDVVSKIFGQYASAFIRLANSDAVSGLLLTPQMNDAHNNIISPWKEMLVELGQTPEFQVIQVADAQHVFDLSVAMTHIFALWSERGVALLYDVHVQDNLGKAAQDEILVAFKDIDYHGTREEIEVAKMTIIAQNRASRARPAYQSDVLARKLCIARGAGLVHGKQYELKSMFDIDLAPYVV